MKILSLANGAFTAGVNTGDVLGATPDLSRYNVIMVYADQPLTVEGSLDGVIYPATALALEDAHVAAGVGTRVLVTAAAKMYRVAPGSKFTKIRLKQSGATPATVVEVLLGRSQGD